MAPVLRIALRRLTRDRRRNILLAIAVLVSIAMLAFLAEFGLLISVSSGSAHNGLPFTSFLNRMRLYTYVAVSVIAVMTLLTIRIHCDTHGTENVRTLAVLTSTGATAWQKGQLIFTEYIVLYMPPLIIGTALGLPSGAAAADRFLRATGVAGTSVNMFAHVVLPALVILISGALLILACNTVPAIKIRKAPIISAESEHRRSRNTARLPPVANFSKASPAQTARPQKRRLLQQYLWQARAVIFTVSTVPRAGSSTAVAPWQSRSHT